MNLYILRHGIAEELEMAGHSKDSERQLTAEGRTKLQKIVKGMKQLGLSLDWIISSPFVRAEQTGQIVSDKYRGARFELCHALVPSGSFKKLIDFVGALHGANEDVMLIGHEPYLSELISLLICGQTNAGIQMKKGGLCKISIGTLRHARCGVLEWLLTPKQLIALS